MNRVLIVLKDLRTGSGVVQTIMNYYPSISTRFNVDFLLLDEIPNKYTSKIKGNIYYMPKSIIKYSIKGSQFLKRIFINNKYDIIHVNIPGPYGALVLKYAKKYGVNNRIYHCHCPREKSNIKSFLSSNFFTDLCIKRSTYYIACSRSAGMNVFRKPLFKILKNRIDVANYKYDVKTRTKLREEIELLENDILICTVGRMEPEKNPFFLIDVLTYLLKNNKNIRFIWFGDGSLKQKIIKYSKEKGIYDKIIYAGVKENVNKWYSAADYFILPSMYEGLGLVLLEAQCSGLTCFTSSNVPKDTKISNYIQYIDLKKGASYWGKYITNVICNDNNNNNRLLAYNNGYDNDFDIDSGKYALNIIYEDILKNGDDNNEQ